MRLHDFLLDGAMRRPDSIALHAFDSGEVRSFAAAVADMERIAAALAALGVVPGDRVGLFAPNRIEYPLAMLGIWRTGAISTHLSVQFGEQLDYYLDDARPKVLIHAAAGQPDIERHRASIAKVRHLVCLDGPAPGAHDWQQLLLDAGPAPPDRVGGDQGAHLSWTSGSTGKPKGVLIGHAVTARACRAIAERLRLSHRDVTCGPTSLSSSYHLVANLLPGLFAQARVGLMAQWDPARAWDDFERHAVTVAPANSTLLAQLLDECRRRGRAPAALRLLLTGGVPTPPSQKRAWRDEFAITLAESYGQSELGGFIGLGYPDLPADARLAASGPSLPDREVRVFNPESGAQCGPEEVGEIAVAGGCMLGYWEKPEQTAQVVRDGWLYSGDLGHLDRDGYVFMRGRASDILQVDGHTLYPRDAEDAAYEHAAVLHAALVGVPRPDGGHRPVLFLAPVPGATLTPARLAEEVARFLVARLEATGAAIAIRVLDALPLTPTSKVDRVALRARAAAAPLP